MLQDILRRTYRQEDLENAHSRSSFRSSECRPCTCAETPIAMTQWRTVIRPVQISAIICDGKISVSLYERKIVQAVTLPRTTNFAVPENLRPRKMQSIPKFCAPA